MHKILLIEDDKFSQELVRRSLGDSYKMVYVTSLKKASSELLRHQFDLILLDLTLPDGDGFKFCSAVQNNQLTRKIPLIILTAKDDVDDKVMGFSLGADDYIVKPFHSKELRARIEGKIRKYKETQTSDELIMRGQIKIDVLRQKMYLNQGCEEIDLTLTPLEFKLLLFLAKNEDRVFTRNQLLMEVWGTDVIVTDRSIDTQISGLRKKMGSYSKCLQSIYGEGYRFTSSLDIKPKDQAWGSR